MTDSIRSRTWVWNPFITESTMISAITPSAIDTTDVAEMKETNRSFRPVRRPERV